MRELDQLLGRAQGYIEAQPVGGERPAYSRAAYARYAKRGLEGFGKWGVRSADAERLVRAGVRMVTLERLKNGAGLLEAALADGDEGMARRAAEEVRECLDVLSKVPARVRGSRAARSRDGAAHGEAAS